jgi:hypothetical protein
MLVRSHGIETRQDLHSGALVDEYPSNGSMDKLERAPAGS